MPPPARRVRPTAAVPWRGAEKSPSVGTFRGRMAPDGAKRRRAPSRFGRALCFHSFASSDRLPNSGSSFSFEGQGFADRVRPIVFDAVPDGLQPDDEALKRFDRSLPFHGECRQNPDSMQMTVCRRVSIQTRSRNVGTSHPSRIFRSASGTRKVTTATPGACSTVDGWDL